jgi:hypothetical protein
MKTREEQLRDRFIMLQDAEESLAESPELVTLVCSFGTLPVSMRKNAIREIAQFSAGFVEKRLREEAFNGV